MVLNGQGQGRHPLGDVLCRDLDTVLSEQGSGCRFLSDALPRCLGVVLNDQGSSYLAFDGRVGGVRKLVELTRICLNSWNVGSITNNLRELVDTTVKIHVNILAVHETKWKVRKAKVENTEVSMSVLKVT